MRRGELRPPDRLALVALGGVVISLIVWAVYAWLNALLDGRQLTSMDLASPDPRIAWTGAMAVISVLLGTLVVEILYARHLDAAEQLRLERNRTREMYENSPDAIISLDPDGVLEFANFRVRERLEIELGRSLEGLRCHQLLYGREERCEDCVRDQVLAQGQAQWRSMDIMSESGERRCLDSVVYPVRGDGGAIEAVVEVARDVTELRVAQEDLEDSHRDLESRIAERTRELSDINQRLRTEVQERQRVAEALATSERRYRSLIEDAPDMVILHDGESITFVNMAGARMLGADDRNELVGGRVGSVFVAAGRSEPSEQLVAAMLDGTHGHPVPAELRRLDGSRVPVEISGTALSVDGARVVQWVVRDVSERVRAEETVKRMAYYDALTGLPNRTLFLDRLSAQIASARRNGRRLAVAFIDLDDFKVVNDTLGHAVGDSLLKAVGDRISGLLRESDTVARQSGDEFTVVAELTRIEDADRLAERLIEGIGRAFQIDGREIRIGCSVGLAMYPDHGTNESDLLRNADTAMYRGKELGLGHYQIYQPQMGTEVEARLRLEGELRRAVERDELVVEYQPQVDVRDSRVVGVEALVRWRHPDRGLISPGEFLPVAEQCGLITTIGRRVLQEALTTAKQWHDDGLDFGHMAVNLSAREFLQPNAVSGIASVLRETGLAPEMLELEVTESVAMHAVDHVLGTLTDLRALGVRIAIDDFGTGYSAMSYLQRFPIQTLKIAQTFMRDVSRDRNSAAIAAALIELCHVLDLDIVAEGVEESSQVEFLMKHGAYVVQGFAYHRPMAASAVRDLLVDLGRQERTSA